MFNLARVPRPPRRRLLPDTFSLFPSFCSASNSLDEPVKDGKSLDGIERERDEGNRETGFEKREIAPQGRSAGRWIKKATGRTTAGVKGPAPPESGE